MKVIIFGATGYVGKRLTAKLLQEKNQVVCFLRDEKKISPIKKDQENLEIFEGDLFDKKTLHSLPKDIDVAYYLVHSLPEEDFEKREKIAGQNFLSYIETTKAKQIIFLSGIINDTVLSAHLRSRKKIEELLQSSSIPSTILRAGIIIGSESASFIILRDLTEKLPIMVAPKWIKNRLKPISIYDTIFYLMAVAGKEVCYNQIYDISSDDELSYKELLFLYAKIRDLQRIIITVPVLTPRLSSYWLIFITSQDFNMAKSLVDSLKNNFLPNNEKIKEKFPHSLLSCEESIKKTIAPLDEEASFFFSLKGKIPKDVYPWKIKQFTLSELWKELHKDEDKIIYYRQKRIGEYWVEKQNSSYRGFFRPRGALGRVYKLLTLPFNLL